MCAGAQKGKHMRTEIIYEDKDILVIYKPAGLAVQTAHVGQPDVVSELKNYLAQSAVDSRGMDIREGNGKSAAGSNGKGVRGSRKTHGKPGNQAVPYLGVVHRLDQPVEGLLVFARHQKAAAGLSGQLQKQDGEGSLNKQYLAVLWGWPDKEECRLEGEIYKDVAGRAVVLDCPGREQGERGGGKTLSGSPVKKAALYYKTLGKKEENVDAGNGRICLADITIETGRFHQIRAQMAHAGYPLLGDTKYGTRESVLLSGQLQVKTVALCAYKLEFAHPVTGEKLYFRAEPRGRVFSLF